MEKYNHVILALYAAAQQRTPTDFQRHGLGLLKQVVGFDSAVVLNVDASPGAKLAVRSMHLSDQPPEQLLAWDQLQTPDHVLLQGLRQRGTPLFRDSHETFKAQPDFMAYCRRFEIAHTMILITPETAANDFDLMSMWRARPADHYAERERRACALLLPHFFQASQISRRLFAPPASDVARRQVEVSLLSNLNGCLHFAPPDALALLQREWREWTPPFLPRELLDCLASNRLGQYVGKQIVVNARLLDQMLHLQIGARPASAALTGAERNVAILAADGLSYKEIARQLGNSPATVRNQLHSVYAKLGVSNKTQLAAALQPA